jgi:RimJ/RimL family protein N-acetyltransferase
VIDFDPAVSSPALDMCSTLGDCFALLDHSADAGIEHGNGLARGSYESRRVTLRPLRPADTSVLYEASLNPRNAHRWRFRGRTPSPEVFQAQLYHSVFAQLGVSLVGTDRLVGLVSCYDENLAAGHAKFAFQRCGSYGDGGEMVEGMALFLNYVFDHWPFRKLYAELPEYNLPLVDGLIGTVLKTEGVMREFEFYNGTRWDLHGLSLSRHDWETFMDAWQLTDIRQRRGR